MIDKMIFEHNPRHSGFQIENFMIGGHSTKYGCYRQALREVFSRLEEVQRIQDSDKKSPQDLHLCREFCHLYLIAANLRGQLGNKLEDLESLEADYWANRLRDEAVMELIADQRVSKATLQSIHKIPVGQRIQILDDLSDSHKRLEMIEEMKKRESIVPKISSEELSAMTMSLPGLLSEAKKLLESHECLLTPAT